MSDLDGLVPWLHEQLDGDERRARAAAEAVDGADWSPREAGGVAAHGPRGITVAVGPDGFMNAAVEDHIAGHDPARVLRAVDAKRSMLDHYERVCRHVEHGLGDPLTKGAVERSIMYAATEFADRPGYKKTWRP